MKILLLACVAIVAVKSELKLQANNVCFGGKGSKFGTFNVQRSGLLTAIKLAHTSGQVNCRGPSWGLSFWGCGKEEIGTIITNENNEVIFPTNIGKNAWFKVPNYNSKSPQLVYTNAVSPSKVTAGQTLRIWYGEDLRRYYDSDNSGQSCANVYAEVTPDVKLQSEKVCFGAKGSKFGTFKIKESGSLTAIKLVHTSGQVNCRGPSWGLSFWGCGKEEIGTIITDENNKVIFPTNIGNNAWFKVPNYNSKSSQLVYSTPTSAIKVTAGQTLRIWYGEDLRQYYPNDNSGESCAGVYAEISPDFQLQSDKVCFGAKGKKFGTFKLKDSGNLAAIKLVHTSGLVNCRGPSWGRSFWGCAAETIGATITNEKNDVIFPSTAVKTPWFKVPNYNSNSQQLVYSTPASHTKVNAGQTLRLWYGEDLRNHFVNDNSGESCAKVYADIRPDFEVQSEHVCFGAKGSKFGTFKVTQSGSINRIKMVHVSGQVNCRGPSWGLSYWGCGKEEIGIIITNEKNEVIFPTNIGKNAWFKVPNYNSKSSQLVYSTATSANKVTAGQTLRVWYGEDLRHYYPNDNSGESCADVYADIS